MQAAGKPCQLFCLGDMAIQLVSNKTCQQDHSLVPVVFLFKYFLERRGHCVFHLSFLINILLKYGLLLD